MDDDEISDVAAATYVDCPVSVLLVGIIITLSDRRHHRQTDRPTDRPGRVGDGEFLLLNQSSAAGKSQSILVRPGPLDTSRSNDTRLKIESLSDIDEAI